MQVIFEAREAEAAALRDLAERRLHFVLRRLRWLVPQARIRMADINGPRGGVDKRCQVELRTEGGGTVVVTAVARHWRDALDQALARAGRALLRGWQRSRRHAAPPLPA
jgi:uncharacterized protein YndB with AHSA1/START domain